MSSAIQHRYSHTLSPRLLQSTTNCWQAPEQTYLPVFSRAGTARNDHAAHLADIARLQGEEVHRPATTIWSGISSDCGPVPALTARVNASSPISAKSLREMASRTIASVAFSADCLPWGPRVLATSASDATLVVGQTAE